MSQGQAVAGSERTEMGAGGVPAAVRAHIARRFPELVDTSPTVERRGATRVFTFRRRLPLPVGPSLEMVVRITVDDRDKILKVVTSR